MASSCALASPQHGIWVPRASDRENRERERANERERERERARVRESGGSCIDFYDVGLEVRQHHF